MAEELPDLVLEDWWRYLVSAIGLLLLVVGVGTVLLDARLTGEELLQISALVVLCGLLVAVGIRISLDMDGSADAVRVLAWMSAGVLALAALGGWFQFVVPTTDTAYETLLVFLSALAAGALFGAVVGYYNVRERRLVERASREQARSEFLDEQQEALSVLNGILRHQILNDASAISGRAQLLDAGKIDAADATDSIVAHCDHMTATVERIETVVDVLTWVTDTSEAPIDESLDRALAELDDVHSETAVTVEGDTDAVVLADELLYLAIFEVLDNAVRHGEGEVSVAVRADADSATIAVEDRGDDVAVSPPETLFEPNTRGPDSEGDGLGLFLADLIVDRYDGTVRLARESSTAFEIEVPTADADASGRKT